MAREGEEDLLIGAVFAEKLTLREVIGTGSMGRVYRADHATLDRPVAVKVLGEHIARDRSLVARFITEARAASRLDHPNGVRVFDVGVDPATGRFYIAMELVEGEDLGAVLRREHRLPLGRAASIAAQVLAALGAAHRAGVIHRDLKPANVMLRSQPDDEGRVVDRVKLCDFGIAKIISLEGAHEATMAELTRAGAIFGTPAYMAPEQARGERADERSDLYSCGAILYRMLGGATPYRASSAAELLGKLAVAAPDSILEHCPDLDPAVAAVVHRALERDRNARFASAREMREALESAVFGRTLPPLSDRPTEPSAVPGWDGPRATRGSRGDREGTERMGVVGAAPLATVPSASASQLETLPGVTERRAAPRVPIIQAPPTSPRAAPRVVAGLLGLAALGAVAWAVLLQARDPVRELQRLVDERNYGVAETYFLAHFEELEGRADAAKLARAALALRRETERCAERLQAPFDPAYRVAPSVWNGETTYEESGRLHHFTLTIDRVGGATFVGRLDWPKRGFTSEVHGLHEGNHVMLWDTRILDGEARASGYQLENKLNLWIDGDRLRAVDAEPPDKLEARRVGARE